MSQAVEAEPARDATRLNARASDKTHRLNGEWLAKPYCRAFWSAAAEACTQFLPSSLAR
jgi:hypothetical protein